VVLVGLCSALVTAQSADKGKLATATFFFLPTLVAPAAVGADHESHLLRVNTAKLVHTV
jgi:hypothetical protein